MNNWKKNSTLALLGVGVIMVFNGCSKLATLKQIVGLWILASLNYTYIDDLVITNAGVTVTNNEEMTTTINGGTETATTRNISSAAGITSSVEEVCVSTVSRQIDIKDDGTYVYTETRTPDRCDFTATGQPTILTVFIGQSETTTEAGHWYFANSDKKNTAIMLEGWGEWNIEEIDKKQMTITQNESETNNYSEIDYSEVGSETWNTTSTWDKQK